MAKAVPQEPVPNTALRFTSLAASVSSVPGRAVSATLADVAARGRAAPRLGPVVVVALRGRLLAAQLAEQVGDGAP